MKKYQNLAELDDEKEVMEALEKIRNALRSKADDTPEDESQEGLSPTLIRIMKLKKNGKTDG